jgi:hypothetical protein
MKRTHPPGDGTSVLLAEAATAVPQQSDRRGKGDAADDTETLAALTFELMLVAGRPCLVTQGPYDVGRIRLF